jgi:hypothetical protein
MTLPPTAVLVHNIIGMLTSTRRTQRKILHTVWSVLNIQQTEKKWKGYYLVWYITLPLGMTLTIFSPSQSSEIRKDKRKRWSHFRVWRQSTSLIYIPLKKRSNVNIYYTVIEWITKKTAKIKSTKDYFLLQCIRLQYDSISFSLKCALIHTPSWIENKWNMAQHPQSHAYTNSMTLNSLGEA